MPSQLAETIHQEHQKNEKYEIDKNDTANELTEKKEVKRVIGLLSRKRGLLLTSGSDRQCGDLTNGSINSSAHQHQEQHLSQISISDPKTVVSQYNGNISQLSNDKESGFKNLQIAQQVACREDGGKLSYLLQTQSISVAGEGIVLHKGLEMPQQEESFGPSSGPILSSSASIASEQTTMQSNYIKVIPHKNLTVVNASQTAGVSIGCNGVVVSDLPKFALPKMKLSSSSFIRRHPIHVNKERSSIVSGVRPVEERSVTAKTISGETRKVLQGNSSVIESDVDFRMDGNLLSLCFSSSTPSSSLDDCSDSGSNCLDSPCFNGPPQTAVRAFQNTPSHLNETLLGESSSERSVSVVPSWCGSVTNSNTRDYSAAEAMSENDDDEPVSMSPTEAERKHIVVTRSKGTHRQKSSMAKKTSSSKISFVKAVDYRKAFLTPKKFYFPNPISVSIPEQQETAVESGQVQPSSTDTTSNDYAQKQMILVSIICNSLEHHNIQPSLREEVHQMSLKAVTTRKVTSQQQKHVYLHNRDSERSTLVHAQTSSTVKGSGTILPYYVLFATLIACEPPVAADTL